MPIPYNLKLTDTEAPASLLGYLEEKLVSLEPLCDLDDPTLLCDVELGRETTRHQGGKVYRAEVNLRAFGKQFRAVATEETLEAALDEVKDELKKELRRAKNRERNLLRRGGAAVKRFLRFGRGA